jgi:hypothetical protein
VAPDGTIVISSRLGAGDDALAAAIARAVRLEGDEASTHRLSAGGEAYAVTFSPLYFRGWRLAVAIPESDFLGDIERMRAWVALGLVAFVLVIGIGASIAARRLVARPLERVVADIAVIERFALDAVPLRRSPLREIDRLSSALVRMSNGLADFAKFIPTELVRRLLAEGIRAEPAGGAARSRSSSRTSPASRACRKKRAMPPSRSSGPSSRSLRVRSRGRAGRWTSSSATPSWRSGARRCPMPITPPTPAPPRGPSSRRSTPFARAMRASPRSPSASASRPGPRSSAMSARASVSTTRRSVTP